MKQEDRGQHGPGARPPIDLYVCRFAGQSKANRRVITKPARVGVRGWVRGSGQWCVQPAVEAGVAGRVTLPAADPHSHTSACHSLSPAVVTPQWLMMTLTFSAPACSYSVFGDVGLDRP